MCGIPSNDPGITHVMELPWRFLRRVNYCESSLYCTIYTVLSTKAARRVTTRYLQCFKARQAGEHLVVHFSQPILGQKPAKRKLVTSRNEVHEKIKRDCELSRAATYNLRHRFLRVHKYRSSRVRV